MISKSIYTILLSFAFSNCLLAQEVHPGGEKIRALKVNMISQEVKLTESQADKFWPIYNNYADEKMAIHRNIRQLSRKNEGLSTEEILKLQDEILELKQKEIIVLKKYRENFLKVISLPQYAKMIETESKFNEMLFQKLRERQEK